MSRKAFRFIIWALSGSVLAEAERINLTPVIESRSQQVFTLSNGRTDQDRERMISWQNGFAKNCRIREKGIWKRFNGARDRDKKDRKIQG